MKAKRFNIEWTGMAGLGPAAWNQDHHTLNMHTPHHEEHHQAEWTSERKEAAGSHADAPSGKTPD